MDEEINRHIGIRMLVCFGRTTFKLSKADVAEARKLRREYLEKYAN